MRRYRSIAFVCLCLLSLPVAAGLSFIQPGATPFAVAHDSSGVVGLATADFDGDGRPDLAITYYDNLGSGNQGFVVVMLGNGDGTFQPPTPIYALPLNMFAYGILAKDFDGDGKIDLVVAVRESHQVLLFKGDGKGAFAAPIATDTGHLTQALQAADLNHDGILDLVALNPEDNSVSVLIGKGDGTFQTHVDYTTGSNPLDVAIGDVNGDGHPDIVVGNYGGAAVGVLLNDGTGAFGAMASYGANMGPQGLYLADFDGDGKLDVIAAGNNCNNGNIDGNGCMVFMKGDGAGHFATPADANFTGIDAIPIRRYSENVAPDLNGDGKKDVVFVNLPVNVNQLPAGRNLVTVGLGRGDGTFDVAYWVGSNSQPVAGANPDFVVGIAAVIGDFDTDGVLDIAFATQGRDNTRGGVSILFGDTPGTFDVPRSYPANYRGFQFGGPPRGGAFGDFTGDGKIDFVTLDGATDGYVPSPMLDLFRGNGDGTFRNATTALPWDPGHSGFSSTLRSADFDKNGTLDLVFFGPQSAALVASGNGDGTFTVVSSFGYNMGASPRNMVIADFDGDGFPDIAVFEDRGCSFPNSFMQVEILLQSAGGTKTFSSKSLLPVNGICFGGTALVAADFDKDGKIDLVVPLGNNTNGANASALFFKGNGDGTFQPATTIGTGLTTILDYTAADLRRNGNLDLIGVGQAVYVQLGNGDGTFQPPVAYGFGFCGDSRCTVKVADLDGDGIPDIAVLASDVSAGFGVLLGNGDGTFKPAVKFATGATLGAWMDIADVNGDGLPDVVIGHSGDNGNGYTVLINTSKPPSADLAITKDDSPDPVIVGSNLTYTITVKNNGPSPATAVSVSDTLPNGVNFVSATPSQGNCSGTNTVTCNLGTLANGSSATVTLVVTPTQPGGISNTATVTATEPDPDASNNSATAVTTVNAPTRLLTALSPAKLWVGQNGRLRKLTYDVMAEVLVNGVVVGTGQVSNVSGGGATFKRAVLDTMSLALNGPTPAPTGATLAIRASVRISCAKVTSGLATLARLWYNGKAIDTGTGKDAGSRFDATIGGSNSNYFLRTAFALATTAGSSKQSIDVAVNDTSPCPGRAFTPFGTWSVSLP